MIDIFDSILELLNYQYVLYIFLIFLIILTLLMLFLSNRFSFQHKSYLFFGMLYGLKNHEILQISLLFLHFILIFALCFLHQIPSLELLISILLIVIICHGIQLRYKRMILGVIKSSFLMGVIWMTTVLSVYLRAGNYEKIYYIIQYLLFVTVILYEVKFVLGEMYIVIQDAIKNRRKEGDKV